MRKLLFFFTFALLLSACADGRWQPTLQEQLQGAWVRADNPKWHYQFDQGFCTSWIYDFGATIQPRWYDVTEYDGNKLELVNQNTGAKTMWAFSPVSGTVTVTDYTDGQPYIYFNLVRE